MRKSLTDIRIRLTPFQQWGNKSTNKQCCSPYTKRNCISTCGGPQTGVNVPGLLPMEESYIENILRLNLGKMATIYMTYENNSAMECQNFQRKIGSSRT